MRVYKDEFEIIAVSKEKESTETGKKYFTLLLKIRDYTKDFGIRITEDRVSHDSDLSKFAGKKVIGYVYESHYEGKTSTKILEILEVLNK